MSADVFPPPLSAGAAMGWFDLGGVEIELALIVVVVSAKSAVAVVAMCSGGATPEIEFVDERSEVVLLG